MPRGRAPTTRWWSWIAGAALLIPLSTPTAAPAEPIAAPLTIATEGAFAPWSATDAAGQLYGFEVDLANELCRRMQTECRVIAQDWDGILASLQQHRYDAVMAGVAITPERAQVVSFSKPYAADPAALAARINSPAADAFVRLERNTLIDLQQQPERTAEALSALAAQLRGTRVGVQTSTTHARLIESQFPDALVQTYERLDEAALDLTAGRLDYLLTARSVVDIIGKAAGGAIVPVGPMISGGALGTGVGVVVRKDSGELVTRFNAAIESAVTDGSISAISNKWFGFDIAPRRR